MIKPELFDTVELLHDLPETGLRAGMLGAIVHAYGDDAYEVEFADDNGETLATRALRARQFIVVWQHATQSAVLLFEQTAQLVANLDLSSQREVSDFARFLHTRLHQAASPVA